MSELHADSIQKSFGDNQILTDVFLSCKKGEIIGLLGRNGTGKSTLLKVLFGSLRADRKFIRVDGQILRTLSETQDQINYLPQNNFLPDHLRISKVVSLFCSPQHKQAILKHDLIGKLSHKKTKELSGGERRFLEILLMVYSQSKFTLLDEPFNGVAPVYKDEIKAILKQESKNKGLIITDHDYRNVLDIANKIILIHDGGTRVLENKEELVKWGYIPVDRE